MGSVCYGKQCHNHKQQNKLSQKNIYCLNIQNDMVARFDGVHNYRVKILLCYL